MPSPVSRVVDLLDPSLNTIVNMDVGGAHGAACSAAIRKPSAPSTGRSRSWPSKGSTVRLARSMDRPMRYFLAKRQEGPALYVADRIDTLHRGAGDRRPGRISFIRATRAWCRPTTSSTWRSSAVPIPIPSTRASSRRDGHASRGSRRDRPAVRRRAGRRDRQVAAVASTSAGPGPNRSGSPFPAASTADRVFLLTYHAMLRLGMSPSRLKAFVLESRRGP